MNFIFLLFLLFFSNLALATDLYSESTGELIIPSVDVSGTNYNNVVINLGRVLKIGGIGGFSLQNFYPNLYSKPRKAVLTAQDTAIPQNQYVLTETITPTGDTFFENQLVSAVNISLAFTKNGSSVGNFTALYLFAKGNFNKSVGINGFGSYTIFSNYNFPIQTIKIGDFLYANSSFSYKDNTKKSINNYSIYYLSLEQSNDGNSAYFCSTENQIDPVDVNQTPPVSKQCFQVDNKGNLLGSVNGLLNVNNTNLFFSGTIQ
jgi:hypothetical protein